MKCLVLLFCILAACEGRTLDDDEPSRPPPDVADDDDEIPCADKCSGVCVDLENDNNNCGACGHECKDPDFFGPCEDGSCPAAYWCGGRSPEFSSCIDVCASYGQRCIDGPPQDRRVCGGEHRFFQSSAIDFEVCEDIGESHYSYGLERNGGIDWSIIFDTPFDEAVACCCTQEPT